MTIVIRQLKTAPTTAAMMPVMARGLPFKKGSFSMRRIAARPSPKAPSCGATERKPKSGAPSWTAIADIKKPTKPPDRARRCEKRAIKDSWAG